jgi:hypothetical protein
MPVLQASATIFSGVFFQPHALSVDGANPSGCNPVNEE